jgi:menaquinone-dependent protoporphyrinogen oxidase
MQRIGVLYATREGQARKVAEHIHAALLARGLWVSIHDVKDSESVAAFARSEAVVIVGSVHVGKHEAELVEFIRAHRPALEAMPAAFLSVCSSESAAEHGATPEARAAGAEHVAKQLRTFAEATGWHPARVLPIAGALLYTHYNPLVRWVMKHASKTDGLPTDTSRDYEFTDWGAIDALATKLADEMHASLFSIPLAKTREAGQFEGSS